MKVTAPSTRAARSLQQICQAARQANCGECWQKPGTPCAHDPEGDHVARFGRAARRGLITGPELVVVLADFDVFTPRRSSRHRAVRDDRHRAASCRP